MFVRFSFLFLIFCVLSVFGLPCISDAGPSLGNWQNAEKWVDNAYQQVTNEVNLYNDLRSGVGTLIGDWNRNEEAIKTSNQVTLLAAGGVIVSGAVAIASGGLLYPAAYAATAVAVKKITDDSETSAASAEYLTAMSTMVSLMDSARGNVTAAYSGGYLSVEDGTLYTKGYNGYYDDYLKMAQGHIDGYTLLELTSAVKMGQLSGYYHAHMHWGDTNSQEDHVFSPYWPLNHWAVAAELGYNYTCKGPCSVNFRTPYEALMGHRTECEKKHGPDGSTGVEMWSCGSGTCPEAYIHWKPCKKCGVDVPQTLSGIPPMESSIPEGWDGHEYICQQKVGLLRCTNHAFTCQTPKCTNADNHTSGSSSGNTVSPSASLSGSSSASAGDSVVFELATATPFSSVYWYVAGPGESGLGSHVETDTGGSSSTTESFTYTFPSDATLGDWTITAYIYNYSDSSTYETTYTVSVSGSSSSDATPDCSDCTSHCSSPCSCSNSGTCDGSVSTPPTPSTPPSTPSTPTTVACGGASYTGCTASVSSRTEHHVPSCSNCGSSYWTCSEYAYRHTDVKTCKRSGCGATLTPCQNGPGKCVNGGYHWL